MKRCAKASDRSVVETSTLMQDRCQSIFWTRAVGRAKWGIGLDFVSAESFGDLFRDEWNTVEGNARCIFNCIDDGRGRPVHR